MHRDYYADTRLDFRRVAGLLGVALLIALGVVVALRLSSDAIAVLVGVVAGVAASIPTALLLMAVTRRQEREEPEYYEDRRPQSPPVIVVTPGGMPQVLPQYGGAYPQQLAPGSGSRQFRVMGYDDEDLEPMEQSEAGRWYEQTS